MSNIKFSCILPVYNIENEVLYKCVDSILKQDYRDFEIIIVDDGSNENTSIYCDSLSSSIVKVIHQPNQGLAGARNTGVRFATGEWIVHIDSDDWISPTLLSEIIPYIEGKDIVYWGYTIVRANMEIEHALGDRSYINPAYYDKESFLRAILFDNIEFSGIALNTTWAKAFRREFLISNNLSFDLRLRRSQDVIFNLYAFNVAKAVSYVPTSGYYYRMDNESLSRGYNAKTAERMTLTAKACVEFYEKNKALAIEESIYNFCRRCFRILVIQDFLCNNNPKKYSERKNEFKTTILSEPFKKAFSVNFKYQNPIENLEYKCMKYENLRLLSMVMKIRSFFWGIKVKCKR